MYRAMLTGVAIVALYAGLAGACKREDNPTPVEPTAIHTAIPTQVLEDMVTPTVEAIPTEVAATATAEPPEPTATAIVIKPSPTLESTVVKTFELVCDGCTDEQYETFSKNALEDYRTVLRVYGINENDARMVVGASKTGFYSVDFYIRGNRGDAVGDPDDFTTDRRGMRHEIAHAINETLFPTYHSWFDEGLAIYSEGHNFGERRGYKELKEDINNWEKAIGAISPGHPIGSMFFSGLFEDYGLTPENNREALSLLSLRYLETGRELSKTDIKSAYETALGVSLDPLFNLLTPGVKILYNNEKIRSEFGINN